MFPACSRLVGFYLVHSLFLANFGKQRNLVFATNRHSIVVVGSINADTFLPVARIPVEGENLICDTEIEADVPGGKGCTQAVACAKLSDTNVRFVGQFGNDAVASKLQGALEESGVDTQYCGHQEVRSGRGYVFLTSSGQVSAVVSGGSNLLGWASWEQYWQEYTEDKGSKALSEQLDPIFENCQFVLLQREIPEYVNFLVALYCHDRAITVVQDIGGQDRSMSEEMLRLCDYVMPNETELKRLVESFGESSHCSIVDMARILQKHGAKNVLVTQGSHGCTLVLLAGDSLFQPALQMEEVVDETGAGDCFRAGFVTALQEGRPIDECLLFASGAGAISVTKNGAVPSVPSRRKVQELVENSNAGASMRSDSIHLDRLLKSDNVDALSSRGGDGRKKNEDSFPFLIGSRLNSMKDRPDLWDAPLLSPADFLERQATIAGLTCVDFNYPQHFLMWTAQEARSALDHAGMVAGAVCLRYPAKFARGALNHPDATLRREAIQLTKNAAEVAMTLGCDEVVIWSAFDGYDYPFQVNYDAKWDELIAAIQECCDSYPDIKWSLEYKPTDENTRFFTVCSSGSALLFAMEVDRQNFGLTLDVGHMLMSGENPGQSIAMVGKAGKLFGIQLNDGFTRLAAEDGLMFGSVHPGMALDIMYQLRRTNFSGHCYFDTFPQRSDPVREAEYNIRRVRAFWSAAALLDVDALTEITTNHDAVGALELVDAALKTL